MHEAVIRLLFGLLAMSPMKSVLLSKVCLRPGSDEDTLAILYSLASSSQAIAVIDVVRCGRVSYICNSPYLKAIL